MTGNFRLNQELEIPLDRTLLISGATVIDPPEAAGDYPPERVMMLINVATIQRGEGILRSRNNVGGTPTPR